jgi:hypothetical protein
VPVHEVRGKGIKFSLKKCFSEGPHLVNAKYWETIEGQYKDGLQIIPRQK